MWSQKAKAQMLVKIQNVNLGWAVNFSQCLDKKLNLKEKLDTNVYVSNYCYVCLYCSYRGEFVIGEKLKKKGDYSCRESSKWVACWQLTRSPQGQHDGHKYSTHTHTNVQYSVKHKVVEVTRISPKLWQSSLWSLLLKSENFLLYNKNSEDVLTEPLVPSESCWQHLSPCSEGTRWQSHL